MRIICCVCWGLRCIGLGIDNAEVGIDLVGMGIEPEGFDQFGAWGIECHGLCCRDGGCNFFVVGFRPSFGSRGGRWQLGVLDESFC